MDKPTESITAAIGGNYNSLFESHALPPVEPGIERLQKFFPELGIIGVPSHTITMVTAQAKDIRWVERCVPLICPGVLGDTYQEELARVLGVFIRNIPFGFIDLLSLDPGDHPITSTRHSAEMILMAQEEQGSPDIIIVPAQLGTEYASKTIDWVENQYSLHYREFGFRLLDVLITLLAFPQRFTVPLMIDCPGDVCSVAGVADHSPVLYWNTGTCMLAYRPRFEASKMYGSVTGCVLHSQ